MIDGCHKTLFECGDESEQRIMVVPMQIASHRQLKLFMSGRSDVDGG